MSYFIHFSPWNDRQSSLIFCQGLHQQSIITLVYLFHPQKQFWAFKTKLLGEVRVSYGRKGSWCLPSSNNSFLLWKWRRRRNSLTLSKELILTQCGILLASWEMAALVKFTRYFRESKLHICTYILHIFSLLFSLIVYLIIASYIIASIPRSLLWLLGL